MHIIWQSSQQEVIAEMSCNKLWKVVAHVFIARLAITVEVLQHAPGLKNSPHSRSSTWNYLSPCSLHFVVSISVWFDYGKSRSWWFWGLHTVHKDLYHENLYGAIWLK